MSNLRRTFHSDARVVWVTTTLSVLQALLGFGLQFELLRRFARDETYQQLLSILSVFLPLGMIVGSSAGILLIGYLRDVLISPNKAKDRETFAFAWLQGYTLVLTTIFLCLGGLWLSGTWLIDGKLSVKFVVTICCATLIALFSSVTMAYSALASSTGRHGLSVSLSVLPNLTALACIASFGRYIGVYSYPLGWMFGSVGNLLIISASNTAKIFDAFGMVNFRESIRNVISAAKLSPGFIVFGVHQFLDGLLLGKLALSLLPLAAFAQRLIVSAGNVSNSGFVSMTLQDFSSGDSSDAKQRLARLWTRCALLLLGGTVAAASTYFARDAVAGALIDIMNLREGAYVFARAAPWYALGAGFMLCAVLLSRALLLMRDSTALVICAGVIALTYSAVIIKMIGKASLEGVAIAYLLSWLIGAAFLAIRTVKLTKKI